MKKVWYLYVITSLFFILVAVSANVIQSQYLKDTLKHRNVVKNRVVELIQEEYDQGKSVDISTIIGKVYDNQLDEWQQDYEEIYLPQKITFLSAKTDNSGVSILADAEDAQSIWVVYDGNEIAGFLLFSYIDYRMNRVVYIMNLSIVISYILVMGILIYVNWKILKPFARFSGYPERLSKGDFEEKFPETKNRLFGRFVWGVNMLNDKLSYDKKHINQLVRDRQTLITTIAHGIKTPVSNIKLYANAIETGLYQKDGIPDAGDAEIAVKISKNADDIANLVQEMIRTSSEGLVDFEPDIQAFYVSELQTYVEEEYQNRLRVLHIPLVIECKDQTIIQSDRSGLTRILSQLLENAIKYGDGTGIKITMDKQEEGHYIAVQNKGEAIPENEVPYLFNSFWRGSNATGQEGSGIGLFEAKTIARRLSGEILVKRLEDSRETEFLIYIP